LTARRLTVLPSYAGQLSKGDKSRINALFRKALKRGLSHTLLDIDDLTFTADKRLFGHMSSKTHCLHNLLLPPQRSVRTASSLRTRGHNFTLPHTDFNPYKNSFINRCLFQFLYQLQRIQSCSLYHCNTFIPLLSLYICLH